MTFLVSFNYDTVVENLAVRFGHILGQTNQRKTGSKTITLVKPHGSTSWKMDFGNRLVQTLNPSDGGPCLNSLDPREVDPLVVEPLLLGAVPIKSELIREVQYCAGFCEVFTTVMKQWKEVVQALQHALRIVIVGYSFPREDHYGRFLIQEALKSRRQGKPTVEFFELEERASERAKEIFDAFAGNVEKIIYRGRVSPSPRQSRR